ncbi:mitochondrial RhaT domain-containing protein [Andalucia godoyi]|uniref:Mitochondrial RhaT domain-containing protein n=1 Tax=Andalucia godoyi TaxID=505711 RepID=A0A8K0AG85_ANDGO|nr:mitochondrial RhaT domain-containing protein [Andalucia godoyi]|eukprot:ANDGO_07672.mRNA.1 mitochondrial RhaT domain-containing protein
MPFLVVRVCANGRVFCSRFFMEVQSSWSAEDGDEATGFLTNAPVLREEVRLAANSSSSQSAATTASATSTAMEGHKMKIPWYAWMSLGIAVFAMSAVGPAFKYLESRGLAPLLASAWRTQTMILFLIPCVSGEFLYLKWSAKRNVFRELLLYPTAVACTCAGGVLWGLSLALWVSSLLFTTTVRASMFSSLYPALIVIVYRYRGVNVSKGEICGVSISVSGVVLSMTEEFLNSAEPSPSMAHGPAWIGDLMNIFLSAVICCEIFLSAHARKHISLFMYTCLSSICCLLFLVVMSGLFEHFTWDSDPKTGLFGWAAHEWLLPLLVFGLIVGCIGIAGFNLAVHWIPPLTFSIVQLCDPILVAFMSWCASIEGIPSVWTFLGGIVLSVGTAIVVISEDRRKKLEAERGI